MEMLIVWAIAGIIVAMIAASKGRNGISWFFYGFFIWPVALVHVLFASRND